MVLIYIALLSKPLYSVGEITHVFLLIQSGANGFSPSQPISIIAVGPISGLTTLGHPERACYMLKGQSNIYYVTTMLFRAWLTFSTSVPPLRYIISRTDHMA